MDIRRAFVAGVAGGGGVVGATWLAYAVHAFPIDVAMTVGTLLVRPPGAFAWVLGLMAFLLAAGVFALIYAALFEGVIHRGGGGAGALVGLAHAVLTGVALGALPRVHPLIPEVAAAPGAFLGNLPMGAVTLVALHVLYGGMVGALYASPSASRGRA